MKRKTVTALMAALCVGSSMTAYAAPETMPDGTVFDAEYYTQAYPDVVAELGTDKDALYNHYVTFGRNEGRLAFESDVNEISQEADEVPIEGVLGMFGTEYTLPTWSEYESLGGNNVDAMKKMTVVTTVDTDSIEYHMEQLAPYTVPGYEWRPIQVIIGGEEFNNKGKYEGRWWPNYNYRFLAQHSDNWERLENDDGIYMYQFQVTQDSADYTECKFASIGGEQVGEINTLRSAYFLVPKNYTGNLVFIIRAVKSTDNGTVTDESNAVTYVF